MGQEEGVEQKVVVEPRGTVALSPLRRVGEVEQLIFFVVANVIGSFSISCCSGMLIWPGTIVIIA